MIALLPLFFIIFMSCVVVGIVIACYNAGKMFKDFERGDLDMGQGMVTQMIACGLYSIGGIGAFITGIIWLVTYLKS